MTLADISSIANLLAALGVLITLIYLARQVRQGNMLARYQARQHMVEQAHEELYQWKNDPALRDCFVKQTPLSPLEQETVHYFLLAAMRQREWEWFQFKDGVIKKEVYMAYHEVIALHLGVARTRRWWQPSAASVSTRTSSPRSTRFSPRARRRPISKRSESSTRRPSAPKRTRAPQPSISAALTPAK